MPDNENPSFRIKKFEIVAGGNPPALTEEIREGIRALESESSIEPISKVIILATMLGIKPASEFGISGTSAEALDPIRAQTSMILRKMGLSFVSSQSTWNDGTHHQDYCIAPTQDRAEALR